ncbi:MAG: ATP-dependent helicase, partial [Anaerolineae bacterium]
MVSALEGLNDAQRQAVTAVRGPILVLAGPGSGKTRVLTHRVAYLVREAGIPAHHIMAVTFTNKAAREMKGRLESLMGAETTHLTVGTFHATCARILRREAAHLPVSASFQIFDESDQVEAVTRALKELNLDPKRFQPRAVLSAISHAKAEMVVPEQFPTPDYWHEIVRRVYERYQLILRQSDALDFDDLLLEAVRLFQREPAVCRKYQERFPFILVDEFQDTNQVQYELLRLLAGGRRNIFVVGDEDQSIYRFRGADWRNVTRFRQDFPDTQVILLEQNYRSTQVILDVANAIISRNAHRTPKRLYAIRPGGTPVVVSESYNEQEEGSYIVQEIQRLVSQGVCRPGDCAVMYRTNAQSRPIEDAFVRYGMPYRLVGATRFYARKEIKDVLAYMRLIHNPNDDISFNRIINLPPRGIGSKTLEVFAQWAQVHGLAMLPALQLLLRPDKRPEGVFAEPPALGRRAEAALKGFLELWEGWAEARPSTSVLGLLDRVLEESGYAAYVRDGTEEGEDRWANIMELRTVAQQYVGLEPAESLTRFLEEVSLVSDIDNLNESQDAPTLLTVHMAKGLEFPVVFIAGLEERIFPHSRCFDDPDEMAEERRVCSV